MDADYTAWASAVAAFSAVVSCLFIVIMANATRNVNLLHTIFRLLWTECRFTARIRNLFLVLHKCNAWIYFLLLLTQVDFFETTFYFLESRKFTHYFYFLKSRIFGMYFYFLESSKVIYFWQHCLLDTQLDDDWPASYISSQFTYILTWQTDRQRNRQRNRERTEQPSTLSSRNARFFWRSSSGRVLSGSSGVSTDTHTHTHTHAHNIITYVLIITETSCRVSENVTVCVHWQHTAETLA